MTKRLYWWLMAFMLLPVCAQAAVLRVVTDDNYPPYLYRSPDGKVQGYEADIWKLWEQKTGVKVDLVATDWDSAQHMLLNGQADVIDMIFRTPDREKYYDFSEPYVTQKIAIYVDASITGIHNAADLKGFLVGVQAGDACIEKLQDIGVADLRLFKNYSSMIESASHHQIKMFCMDETPANYYLYRLNKSEKFNKAFELYQASFHQAVKKGNAATLRLVEQGMRQITPAEKAALKGKWYGEGYSQFRYAKLLVEIVIGLLVLLGAAMVWLESLRRAVKSRTAELDRERAQLRTLVENSPDMIWLKSQDGTYLVCNQQASQLLGKTPAEVVGKTDADLVEPEVAVRIREDDLKAIESGQPVALEEWMPDSPSGGTRLLETIKLPVWGTEGNLIGVLGVARDITQRRLNERALAVQASMLKEMSATAHVGGWELDPASGEISWTDEVALIHEIDPAIALNLSLALNFYPGESRRLLEHAVDAAIQDGTPFDLELEMVTARGNHRWVHAICTPLIENGKVVRVRGVVQDISERKRVEAQVEHLAFHDQLTDLPNRRLIVDRLHHALSASMRSNRKCALLMIDLDNFKVVNDAHGHVMGDRLLKQAAERLLATLREGDTPARLGGDEFLVLLEGLSEDIIEAAEQVERVGMKLLDALRRSYLLDGLEFRITCSIGATVFDHPEQQADELIKQADIAMYEAKKSGRNSLRFFDRQVQEVITARASLEGDLHIALDLQQLQVHYQIQVDDLKRPIGAEALVRWNHPVRGWVSPAQFIPLAEESDLILSIGHWVLETACAQQVKWQANPATRDLVVAVNVSARQLKQSNFLDEVRGVLQRHAVDPACLKLEITESMLLNDIEGSIETLKALKKLGVKISLDDFGTGYSSLSYLKQLPLDQLKIDQSFVRDIATDANDRSIVQTIIAMARGLGLEVIAEGVETEGQREFLLNNGCYHYQGYLFGKPMPAAQFEQTLNY